MNRSAVLAVLLASLGCLREEPRTVRNENLGIAATFPGEARLSKREEDTPFGPMQWFDTAHVPTRRLVESFLISVGNLPKGTQGGTTEAEVLATFHRWLQAQLGTVERTPLPPDRGPGFRYSRALPGRWTEGAVVLRRGRIHHAQATVASSADLRVKTFLESFEVK